ncbi:MAG: hypothetical protein KJ592_00255 [Nanoarchaeota archaeon]|nr:hypothetical protein [Nanoarchaeota archaeon]
MGFGGWCLWGLSFILIGLLVFSGLFAFVIQISFILSRFSDIEDRFSDFSGRLKKLEAGMSSLERTFKTSEELNKLRLDIKEFQVKVLK